MTKTVLSILLALAAAASAAPVSAQTLNLYCSNPSLRFSYIVDVNLAMNSVTYRLDPSSAPAMTFPAQISDTQIVWEELPARRGETKIVNAVNRMTGQLNSCDNAEGCFQRVCKPAQRQF